MRSVRKLVVKNTLIQLLSAALSLLLGLVSTAVLSRHLGVDRFGKFSYLFAFYYFFLAANDFGINTVIVREASRYQHRTGKIIGAISAFKLILSLVFLIAAWLTVRILGFSDDFRRGLLIYGLILPITALQIRSAVYQIELRLGELSFLSVLNKSLGLLFIVITVGLNWGVTGLAGALILSEVFYTLYLYWDTRFFAPSKWHLDIPFLLKILRSSIPLGVTALFIGVINRFSFILLERISDLRQLGLFSAAVKITMLLEALPLMIMGTLYPLMSRYAKEDFPRLRSLYRKSFLWLGGSGILMATVISLFSSFWVRLVFGRPYADAAPSLAVLVWSTACLYPAICGGNLLISLGRERTNLIINALAAVLSISLNVWMIPRWGALGASWVALITYGFIFACTLLAVQGAFQKR